MHYNRHKRVLKFDPFTFVSHKKKQQQHDVNTENGDNVK